MIVLDASAAIELLLNTPMGRLVADEISESTISLHAPALLDVEVAQALRRYVHQESLTSERAERALEHLLQLGINRYGHEPLLPRMWALRENLTAYDAAYVALAEALDASLLTLDRRIEAAPGHRAAVHVLT